jgi:nucleotide-binding universal stress UspA family protein
MNATAETKGRRINYLMSKNINILFCTDFSEHANTAFDHAMDQAKKYDAKLHLFHVIMPTDPCGQSNSMKSPAPADSPGPAESEDDLVQQAIGALKLKYSELLNDSIRGYEYVVKMGSPDVEVVQYAKQNDIDMIIMGALGIPEKDRVTRIRTAANVSKFAPCQVVVIQKNVQPSFGI